MRILASTKLLRFTSQRIFAFCSASSISVAADFSVGSAQAKEEKQKKQQMRPKQLKLVNEMDEMLYGIKKLDLIKGMTKNQIKKENDEMFDKLKAFASKQAFELKTDSEEVNIISGHYYSKEGKLVRPSLNFLLSQIITSRTPEDYFQQTDIVAKQRLWASVIENIHVSSLVHDDIIDNAFTRRGLETSHVKFGDREAVFSGDYIIGRSGQQISRFNDIRMYQIYSYIMENLTHGELNQASSKRTYRYNMKEILDSYILKTYYKTASLMAFSAQGVGVLHNETDENQELLFKFAQHLGISFQLADDMLDFTSNSVQLGKAALADLKEGNVTGPVLFSVQEIEGTQEHKSITTMLQKNPKGLNDDQVLVVDRLVKRTSGLEKTIYLALLHSFRAVEILQSLQGIKDMPNSEAFKSLNYLLLKIIQRNK